MKLKLGKQDAAPADPTHVKGVRQGNARGSYEKHEGLLPDGRATAEKATGINPGLRNPIDPRMPNIPPA